MAMDVIGRKPKNKKGEYFQSNVWSWCPILSLMQDSGVCSDKEIKGMSFNEGVGPMEQARCDRIADFIEGKLESSRGLETFALETGSGVRVDRNGKVLHPEEIARGVESFSPYRTNRNHLQDFVEFLRNCGGFEVH
jgi:hypothetical protein